jgi:hypothetical protein
MTNLITNSVSSHCKSPVGTRRGLMKHRRGLQTVRSLHICVWSTPTGRSLSRRSKPDQVIFPE